MKHVDFVEQVTMADPYYDLQRILDGAFAFAATGKGHARHGHGGLPWVKQRHADIGREVGTGFARGQAAKKIYEIDVLDNKAAKIRELQGAITYLASAIFLIEQGVE